MLHYCHCQNIDLFSQNQNNFFGGGRIAIKHPFALEEQVETLYSKIMFEQHFFWLGLPLSAEQTTTSIFSSLIITPTSVTDHYRQV